MIHDPTGLSRKLVFWFNLMRVRLASNSVTILSLYSILIGLTLMSVQYQATFNAICVAFLNEATCVCSVDKLHT